MGLFSAVEMVPRDPILGLNETFNADTHSDEVNLGVDAYYNEEGRIPPLRAVQATGEARIETHASRGHLPIKGIAAYDQGVQKLLFGNESELLAADRVVTAQAAGGTGVLKLGADFLKRPLPDTIAATSDLSWEDRRTPFEAAGFPVQNYRYYDTADSGANRADLLKGLNTLPIHSIVVLYACCHNSTGANPELDDWKQMLDVFKARGHVPPLDIVYQDFSDDIEEDTATVRLFTQSGLSPFVSSSLPRSFSLYGKCVGALSTVTESRDESARVPFQVKRVIRTNYSNPPTHGASIVSSVLNSSKLRAFWERELGKACDCICDMRLAMVEQLATHGAKRDFSFVGRQRGMLFYFNLTANQVECLKTEFDIYTVNTGRIYAAAPNKSNLETITKTIVQVL